MLKGELVVLQGGRGLRIGRRRLGSWSGSGVSFRGYGCFVDGGVCGSKG